MLQSLTDQMPADLELSDDPAILSFQVAAAADLAPADQRRLLASRSPADRVRRLMILLQARFRDLSTRVGVHLRARSNGKGGSPGPHPLP